MTAVYESLEQAQDFIRLLRSENNALRKQIQESEKPVAVSVRYIARLQVNTICYL